MGVQKMGGDEGRELIGVSEGGNRAAITIGEDLLERALLDQSGAFGVQSPRHLFERD